MRRSPNARTDRGPRLTVRVFGAMGLVVLAGAGTLILVSLLVAPAVFHQHLHQAGVTQSSDVERHVEEGFATATLVSTGLGVLAASAVAAAMALLVARRISRPVTVASRTATQLAGGDYSARVTSPSMGPELADLADSVNALAERLESSERIRIRLMSDLAHELRTPLASIDATVEAIADNVLPADAQTLATLTRSSQRLGRLIDDLAAVSRAEEGAFRLNVRPIDLAAVTRDAAAAAAARFAAAGVALHGPGTAPVAVVGDPDRIGEVVGQLLDNALHHTNPGDVVSIQVTQRAESAELTVSDNGGGFEPTDDELIFQRFYRADPARVDGSGSGIGLTIARTLIEAHHGTLRASSPGPGRGATFTLLLPAAKASSTN